MSAYIHPGDRRRLLLATAIQFRRLGLRGVLLVVALSSVRDRLPAP